MYVESWKARYRKLNSWSLHAQHTLTVNFYDDNDDEDDDDDDDYYYYDD